MRTCENCGAHLDANEKCDCQDEQGLSVTVLAFKKLLEDKGITNVAAANGMGVSYSHLCSVLKGKLQPTALYEYKMIDFMTAAGCKTMMSFKRRKDIAGGLRFFKSQTDKTYYELSVAIGISFIDLLCIESERTAALASLYAVEQFLQKESALDTGMSKGARENILPRV